MEILDKSGPVKIAPSRGPVGGALDAVLRGVQALRERVAIHRARALIAQELEGLDDAGLADLGFRRDQIPHLVKAYPDGTKLLPRMLAKLGLNLDGLDRLVQNDLHRTCIMCENRKECRHWVESDRALDGYREFCLNSVMLDVLRAERTRRSAGLLNKAL